MRFCRFCGFRLGEGVAEYAETMRFAGTTPPYTAHTQTATASAPHTAAPGFAHTFGAMSPSAQTTALEGKPTGLFRKLKCSGARMNWMVWLILLVVLVSGVGGSVVRSIRGSRDRRVVVRSAPRSHVGVNTFKDAEPSGALVDYVRPPGSPADKAGLVGGDIIKSFDGREVKDREGLMKMLGSTPIGKTVALEYVRDGETRQTTITTVSKEEMERLEDAYDERPEGTAFFGIDIGRMSELERVFVPELQVYGVKLDDVLPNRPAYIAGLRDGDIVVEFDGTPIRTSEEFVSRFRRAVPDSVVKVVIVRAGQRMEIPLKMGRA
ncbi:MAG TPA: PDZ domain-containing protein [Pyrinomonadaceae bacterium]